MPALSTCMGNNEDSVDHDLGAVLRELHTLASETGASILSSFCRQGS